MPGTISPFTLNIPGSRLADLRERLTRALHPASCHCLAGRVHDVPPDHVRKSRRWIERRSSNVVRYTQAESGGHFAALEQPHVLVDELRAT